MGHASHSCFKHRSSAFLCLTNWTSLKDSSRKKNGSTAEIVGEPLGYWENIWPVRLVANFSFKGRLDLPTGNSQTSPGAKTGEKIGEHKG